MPSPPVAAPLRALLALGGGVLLTLAAVEYYEVLLSHNSTPAPLRVPLIGDTLDALAPGQGTPVHAAVMGVVLVLAWGTLFVWWGAAGRRMVGRLARRPDRGHVLVMLAAFSLAFLPIGGARLLLYFAFAVPGFVLLWVALRPWASGIGSRLLGVGTLLLELPPRRFLLVACLASFTLTNLVSVLLYEHTPHIISGITHVFHARILASGHLYVPSHPLREFFDLHTVINDGRWYAHFPPAHTLMMLVGVFVGAPWVIDPILAALTIVGIYALGRELYDERTARLGALLGVLSPFAIFMSAEFYSHVTGLLFSTFFLLYFARFTRTATLRHAVAAGGFLGLLLNTRPVTAAGIALPFGLYTLWLVARSRRYLAPTALMGVVIAGFFVALMAFNYGTTGNALVAGYQVSVESRYSQEVASWSPWMGVVNTVNRLRLLNKSLFQWPIPDTCFIALLFALGTRTRWDYLLLAAFVSDALTYFFWYFPGFEFGPRYYYECLNVLVLLSARGILQAPAVLRALAGGTRSQREWAGQLAAVLLGCFLIGAVWCIPPAVRLYASDLWYWQVDTRIRGLVREQRISNAVIFVSSERAFRGLFLENAIGVDAGDVIYVRDLKERNRDMMAHYPSRRYYLAAGGELQAMARPGAGGG